MSEVRWPPAGGQITISHSLPGYRHWALDEAGQPVVEGEASSASRARPCARGTGASRFDQRGLLRLATHRPIALAIGCALGRTALIWDGATIRSSCGLSHRARRGGGGLRRQAGVQEAAVRLVGEGNEALVGYVEAKSG